MTYSTAKQTLNSLFSVLKHDQEIVFVYRGGMDGTRSLFTFQIRGKALGATAKSTEEAARRLKQNVEQVLASRPGLFFGSAPFKAGDNIVSPQKWSGSLYPQGMLVSSGQSLKSVSQEDLPNSVFITPALPVAAFGLSVVDAVLASPKIVEVIVSIKRHTLGESGKQVLKNVMQSIDRKNATYFMLPERRKASDEERELWIDPLEQHLKRWLITPWGIELDCTINASERPTEVFISMLGKALYPNQTVVMEEDEKLLDGYGRTGALEMRRCINASCGIPSLFPQAEQLADIGIKRLYPPPVEEPATHGLCLGIAGDKGVYLAQNDRSRHAYIIGATGCGKSTLLYNMVMQDIADGEGVCLMDPHGDLYAEILESIPKERQKDVVLIDPSDFGHTVGINFLEITGPHRQVEMGFIVNGMLKIFDRLYDLRQAGGPIFEQYMRNALLLIIDNKHPGTLMDVARVFEDTVYRTYLKRICLNPLVVSFWEKQAEQAGGDHALKNMGPYITSKLNQFTHNPLLRPIIGQRHSSINFRQIMDDKQILLVNLSKGMLGEFDSQLLGMILIGKLFLAAMGRADVDKAQRVPFHWYIDEFQNFATDSIGHLLSESRKFGIRLTLANQNLAQLHLGYGSMDLREAVLGNVANLLLFRMGVTDAKQLSAYTQPELSSQDLQYLPDFHAVGRLLKHNAPMRPFVLQTLPKLESLLDEGVKAEILAHCRGRYMRPVEDVEKEIFEWAQTSHWEQRKQPTKQEELQQMENRLKQLEQECTVENTKPIAKMSKEELQELRIESLDLTVSVKRGLAAMRIHTVWKLCECSESSLLKELGRKETDKVLDFLKQNRLTLALRGNTS